MLPRGLNLFGQSYRALNSPAIPLEGTNTAVQVGPLAELPGFYDAAGQAIQKGELDEPIMALQRTRLTALKGEGGAARKAA